MSGVMYLGNQMVSPAIIAGGAVDVSKYDILPYINFYGNDYIELDDSEKSLDVVYTMTPEHKTEYTLHYGDKVTFDDSLEITNNGVTLDHINGKQCAGGYFYPTKLATSESMTFEADFGTEVEGASIKSKRIVIANARTEDCATYIIDYPFTIEAGALNLDEYVYGGDYGDAPCVFKNTYLEVTSNTNNKELEFYDTQGTMGFFIKDPTLEQCSFSFKTAVEPTQLTFVDNGLYNVSVVLRDDGEYYYNDVVITPKSKAQLEQAGYTSDEADTLLQLMSATLTEPEQVYQERNSCFLTAISGYATTASTYVLVEVNGTQKTSVLEFAQKNDMTRVKWLLAGKLGAGLCGMVTSLGERYPVVRKQDNVKGFIDVGTNTFYPLVSVPFNVTFNTNYQNCIFAYEIDGVPVAETSNVVAVPPGSTLTYSITKAQEGNVKYGTVTGTVQPTDNETINITIPRTYRITFNTNYSNCTYYYKNNGTGEVYPETGNYVDAFGGTSIYYKISKESEGNVDYSEETGNLTVSEDTTIAIELERTYIVTVNGYLEGDSMYEADNGFVKPSAGEWVIQHADIKEFESIVYNYLRLSRPSSGTTYYEYKELATDLAFTQDRTINVGTVKSYTSTGDFVRPDLTANGTLWSDNFAVDGPAYSATYPAWKAFDNSASTYWRTASNNATLTITNPTPIAISSLTLTFNATSTTPDSVTVYGLIKNQDNSVTSMFLKKQGKTYGSAAFTIDFGTKVHPFIGFSIDLQKSSGTSYLKDVSFTAKNVEENT